MSLAWYEICGRAGVSEILFCVLSGRCVGKNHGDLRAGREVFPVDIDGVVPGLTVGNFEGHGGRGCRTVKRIRFTPVFLVGFQRRAQSP